MGENIKYKIKSERGNSRTEATRSSILFTFFSGESKGDNL